MSLLLAGAIKVSLVLLVALAAGTLLRQQSAAVRHWLLAVAIACALLMPVLTLVAPAWQVPTAGSGDPQVDSQVAISVDTAAHPASTPTPPMRRQSVAAMSGAGAGALLLTVWIAGTALALGVLLVGLRRLATIARSARPVDPGTCQDQARDIARAYGLRRDVRVLYGDHPALLVTWGVRRPTIILPDAARTWTDERLRVVLCHELAHIQRGDWGTLLAAELLRAVYWFNPFAWMACRRLRQESEHACDDVVLNAGIAAPTYATHLLDLARASARRRGAWSPSLPVARPSGLERRVRAMLNAHLDRHPVTRWTRLGTVLAFLALAASLAGVALSAQGPFATVAGSLSDSMRGALPDATLSVTNAATRAKNEVRSDSSGRFEFVGLPPGDYVLEASVPGFRNYRATLALNGQQVDRDIVMDVATLQETITVSDAPPRVRPRSEQDALDRRNALASERLRRVSAACRDAAAWTGGSGGVSPGGRIRPPMKIVDVRPEYPAALREGKVGGAVDLEARIGTDGSVRDVKETDPSVHPDLAAAAIKAVREWRFDETLLNCVPIEVSMTVHVTFTPRQ
jgi:TonB family protein